MILRQFVHVIHIWSRLNKSWFFWMSLCIFRNEVAIYKMTSHFACLNWALETFLIRQINYCSWTNISDTKWVNDRNEITRLRELVVEFKLSPSSIKSIRLEIYGVFTISLQSNHRRKWVIFSLSHFICFVVVRSIRCLFSKLIHWNNWPSKMMRCQFKKHTIVGYFNGKNSWSPFSIPCFTIRFNRLWFTDTMSVTPLKAHFPLFLLLFRRKTVCYFASSIWNQWQNSKILADESPTKFKQ